MFALPKSISRFVCLAAEIRAMDVVDENRVIADARLGRANTDRDAPDRLKRCSIRKRDGSNAAHRARRGLRLRIDRHGHVSPLTCGWSAVVVLEVLRASASVDVLRL